MERTQCSMLHNMLHFSVENSSTVNGNRVISNLRCFGPWLPPDFHEILPFSYSKRSTLPQSSHFLITSLNLVIRAQSLPGPKPWPGSYVDIGTQMRCRSQVGEGLTMLSVLLDLKLPVLVTCQLLHHQLMTDDTNTVYTVLVRCKAISEKLGQTYTVISFDQAFYCRAKEVVWGKGYEFENVIVRLGGLHTAMNFMKAIGQHMDSSVLRCMS